MTADDEAGRSWRCDSKHRTGVRCEKQAGHHGYHWHVGANGTQVWGIPLRGIA